MPCHIFHLLNRHENYMMLQGGDNMENNMKKILRNMMKKFSELSYIRPEDIPDIPLYMDQITTFMETKLESCKRYPEDKLLTKTMINNYTKNRLIPPPDKKKYSRDHLILLIYTYYLKDFLSISDIKEILEPLAARHFGNDSEMNMHDVYREAFDLIFGQRAYMTRDLMRRWKTSEETFADADPEDREYLHLFAFICLLSFDVYVKKKLIESIADSIAGLGGDDS